MSITTSRHLIVVGVKDAIFQRKITKESPFARKKCHHLFTELEWWMGWIIGCYDYRAPAVLKIPCGLYKE